MPTLEASGTQTAIISTEHTLATISNNKTLQLYVDLSALVNGDEVELRIKTKVLSGGSLEVAEYKSYADDQGEITVAFSVPIMSDIESVFTLKQIAGTGRNFPWKVLSP